MKDRQAYSPLRLLGATAAVLCLSVVVFALFASRERIVTVVSDDSYYYLIIAQNLVTLGASTFDGITRTSGYHPLFATVLAAIYALLRPGPDTYVRIMLSLNVFLHLMTGLVLYFAGRRLRDRFTGILAALLYLANPYAAIWTLSGMEASLNGFLVSLFFLSIIPPLRDAKQMLLAGFLGALAVWARTDNFVVIVLSAPVIFLGNENQNLMRRATAAILIAAFAIAALGCWTLAIRTYTGSWIQGSAQIKMLIREYNVSDMTFFQSAAFTFNVFQKFAVKAFIKVPALRYLLVLACFAGPAFFKTRIHRAWLPLYLAGLPLALALAYGLKLTRAATWYYVPSVIALTLLSAWLAGKLMQQQAPSRARGVALIVAALVAIEGISYFGVKMARGRNVSQRDMLELAEWMRNNLPADSMVGAWDSGIYRFYSGLCVINFDGLMNNDIADMMEANRPLWPIWRANGVDSVKNYEFWYAGVPDQYWRYWKKMNIQYIAGATRWLRNIPTAWDGASLLKIYEPQNRYSTGLKALYKIQWEAN